MYKDNKQLLINLCIIIIIIIIIRFLYIRLTTENFTDAIDLLSKKSSNDAIIDNNFTSKSIIKPWTTKLFNMRTDSIQNKAISLYQPKLFIKEERYCKLGDMISQNVNYSPPDSNKMVLLIKKDGSDIKPPINYDLIVNFGNDAINTKYYEFESYINDIYKINSISNNINNCSRTLNDMNNIITNNMANLQINLSDSILSETNKSSVYIGGLQKSLLPLVKFGTNISRDILGASGEDTILLPAGVSGIFETNNAGYITFAIPSIIDMEQKQDKLYILSNLPSTPFQNMNVNNIYAYNFTYKLFELIPIIEFINYLQSLCQDIQKIYDTESNNIPFLRYLNLCTSKDVVDNMLEQILIFKSFLSTYDNINTITIKKNPEISPYLVNIGIIEKSTTTPTLIDLVINIFKTMDIKYNLSYININKSNILITATPTATTTPPTTTTITKIIINKFDNNFLGNIPINNYSITNNTNNDIQNIIMSRSQNINTFARFLIDLSANNITNLPLKIYKPIAPDGYVALGHIFCNTQTQLQSIKDNDTVGNGVCCIPIQCVKEIRDWTPTDKVFEYNKDNIYWALYYNPFTGTFISTNTRQLPSGKVSKVVACVKKCTAVDKLIKSDDCARNYYNMNNKIKNEVNLTPNLVSDQEEVFYLDKLKAQSDSITRLSSKAQTMQFNIDKANIVNREMNQNKLQNYVDTQKRNIDIVTKRLIQDRDSIQTNINVPIDTLNNIITMITTSNTIPQDQKTELISKLINAQSMMDAKLIDQNVYNNTINKVLSSCPNYDLSGLVKKDTVSQVCYGCSSV